MPAVAAPLSPRAESGVRRGELGRAARGDFWRLGDCGRAAACDSGAWDLGDFSRRGDCERGDCGRCDRGDWLRRGDEARRADCLPEDDRWPEDWREDGSRERMSAM